MSFSTDIKEWAPLVHIARTAATRLLPKVTKAVTKAGPSTAATAPSMAIDKGKQVKDAGPGGGYGTPTKKDFPEGQVGTGYVEVPDKIEGSGLVVIDVTTLNENKDSNNKTENLHEQKLRKVINSIIREELNENVQKELKSIDKEEEAAETELRNEKLEVAATDLTREEQIRLLNIIKEMLFIIIISFISFITLILLLFLIILMYVQYFIEDIFKWIYKKFSIN